MYPIARSLFLLLTLALVAGCVQDTPSPARQQELVDLDVRRDAQGPGEDVALRVHRGLGAREAALAFEGGHQAVVLGDLGELAVAHQLR